MQVRMIALGFVMASVCCVAHAELTKHASNGTYGCRRAFGYGVYDASTDKTVICWNGEKMSIYVRAFDHSTQQWSEVVKAHGLNFTGRWDYHNYPCIALAPDGHYVIFYARHNREAYMVKSPGAGRITGDWSHRMISTDKCCYPMPVVVDDTTYLFYSNNTGKKYRRYHMIKSLDSGKTWSDPLILIDSGKKHKEDYDQVYSHGYWVAEGRGGGPDRILLGWEMTGGPKGHNIGGHGNFFAWFNCRDGKMYTAGDKDLGTKIDLEEMYADCIINNAKSESSRLFQYTTYPAVTRDGSIGVAYMLENKPYLANWKQGSWKTTELKIDGVIRDYQGTKNGGYVILAGNDRTVTVWESADGLTGWKKISETTVPSGHGSDSVFKGFIEDFRPEVQWMAASLNRRNRMKDYSGKWPVYTFGVQTGGGCKD